MNRQQQFRLNASAIEPTVIDLKVGLGPNLEYPDRDVERLRDFHFAGWASASICDRVTVSLIASDGSRAKGFTLLELLTVIATSTILAALLFPAVVRARQSGQAAVCIGNQNQLGLAWRLYTDDNRGWFPWAQVFPRVRSDWPVESNQPVWCRGRMDYAGDASDRTNINLLVGPHPGGLGTYLRRPEIYRCPTDRSRAQPDRSLEKHTRVRSYSMNLNFGFPEDLVHELSVFNHERDLRRHASGPSGLSVFWDESEASIASTAFDDPTLHPGEWILASIPATRHRGGSTISFADGHAEVHRWKDPAILQYSPMRSIRGISTAVDSHDFWWICNAMRTRGPQAE